MHEQWQARLQLQLMIYLPSFDRSEVQRLTLSVAGLNGISAEEIACATASSNFHRPAYNQRVGLLSFRLVAVQQPALGSLLLTGSPGPAFLTVGGSFAFEPPRLGGDSAKLV